MHSARDVRDHVGRIVKLAESRQAPRQAAQQDRLVASWRRSLSEHRIDPGLTSDPRVLTGSAFRELRDRYESFVRIGRHAVSSLHAHVRDMGYCVLLADGEGATVVYEEVPGLEQDFRRAGFRPGTCWSEQSEGTNGVGTSIMDRAPTLVHQGDHFRAHNITFTCSAAPVFGPNDDVIAVLDASALSSPSDRRSQALVFKLVVDHALAIENAYFCEVNARNWILQLGLSPDFVDVRVEYLVAFDPEGRILGANRKAREDLFAGLHRRDARLDTEFDTTALEAIRLAHDRPGLPVPVTCLRTGQRLHGLLRAPAAPSVRRVPAPTEPAPLSPRAEQGASVHAPAFQRLGIDDPKIRREVQRVARIANADIAIMLRGETGTGKEWFARAIHDFSERRHRPFVALNCAALPEGLVESELFGYRSGAFTGASAKGARGKVLQSNGGTLFLDEIGDMPLSVQSRLLRVIAEKEIQPLGTEASHPVDLHVICATHRDLQVLVQRGEFREDLYYRLNGATVLLPPLRERTDLEGLIQRVLNEEARACGRAIRLDPDCLATLKRYTWPGNLRELRNTLRYACALCDRATMTLPDLPPEVACVDDTGARRCDATGGAVAACGAACPDAEGEPKRDRLTALLRRHHWHVAPAARELGISRATLYRWMDSLAIVPPNRA
jgi:sigma-54 dependent transcriptional regulator, acetoin dehydrogenase operon transcriptional activator AcoR